MTIDILEPKYSDDPVRSVELILANNSPEEYEKLLNNIRRDVGRVDEHDYSGVKTIPFREVEDELYEASESRSDWMGLPVKKAHSKLVEILTANRQNSDKYKPIISLYQAMELDTSVPLDKLLQPVLFPKEFYLNNLNTALGHFGVSDKQSYLALPIPSDLFDVGFEYIGILQSKFVEIIECTKEMDSISLEEGRTSNFTESMTKDMNSLIQFIGRGLIANLLGAYLHEVGKYSLVNFDRFKHWTQHDVIDVDGVFYVKPHKDIEEIMAEEGFSL